MSLLDKVVSYNYLGVHNNDSSIKEIPQSTLTQLSMLTYPVNGFVFRGKLHLIFYRGVPLSEAVIQKLFKDKNVTVDHLKVVDS